MGTQDLLGAGEAVGSDGAGHSHTHWDGLCEVDGNTDSEGPSEGLRLTEGFKLTDGPTEGLTLMLGFEETLGRMEVLGSSLGCELGSDDMLGRALMEGASVSSGSGSLGIG